jgi:hypothetical protein
VPIVAGDAVKTLTEPWNAWTAHWASVPPARRRWLGAGLVLAAALMVMYVQTLHQHMAQAAQMREARLARWQTGAPAPARPALAVTRQASADRQAAEVWPLAADAARLDARIEIHNPRR